MNNIVCVDCGASSTRFNGENSQIVVIPNNCFAFKEGRFMYPPYSENINDCLEVIIKKNSGNPVEGISFPIHVAYGSVARRMSSTNMRPSITVPKHEQMINIASILTSVAIEKAANGLGEKISLFLALPPAEARESHQKVSDILVGNYTVELPLWGVCGTVINFEITDVHCHAESNMATVAFFFDEKAAPRECGRPYENRKILSVNIGASTTDIAIIENRKYIESSGVTYKIGGNMLRDELNQKILSKYGFEPSQEETEKAIQEGRIQCGAEFMDVSELLTECKANLANAIIEKINTYFNNNGTTIQSFSGILTSGGGSLSSQYFNEQMQPVKTSEPLFYFISQQLLKICKTVNVINFEDSGQDPRLADIIGLRIRAIVEKINEEQMEKRRRDIEEAQRAAQAQAIAMAQPMTQPVAQVNEVKNQQKVPQYGEPGFQPIRQPDVAVQTGDNTEQNVAVAQREIDVIPT